MDQPLVLYPARVQSVASFRSAFRTAPTGDRQGQRSNHRLPASACFAIFGLPWHPVAKIADLRRGNGCAQVLYENPQVASRFTKNIYVPKFFDPRRAL
jgi:hypothetical protein